MALRIHRSAEPNSFSDCLKTLSRNLYAVKEHFVHQADGLKRGPVSETIRDMAMVVTQSSNELISYSEMMMEHPARLKAAPGSHKVSPEAIPARTSDDFDVLSGCSKTQLEVMSEYDKVIMHPHTPFPLRELLKTQLNNFRYMLARAELMTICRPFS